MSITSSLTTAATSFLDRESQVCYGAAVLAALPAGWSVVGADHELTALYNETTDVYVENNGNDAALTIISNRLMPAATTAGFRGRIKVMVNGVAPAGTQLVVALQRNNGTPITSTTINLTGLTSWNEIEWTWLQADLDANALNAKINNTYWTQGFRIVFTPTTPQVGDVLRIGMFRMYAPPPTTDYLTAGLDGYALRRVVTHSNMNGNASACPDVAFALDEANNIFYIVYRVRNEATSGGDGTLLTGSHNEVWFRTYDPETDELGVPVPVDSFTTMDPNGPIHLAYLPGAPGTLIAVYDRGGVDPDLNSSPPDMAYAIESTDSGATWGFGAQMGYCSIPASGRRMKCHALGHDGTNVVAVIYWEAGGGAGIGYTARWKRRTAPGTWVDSTTVLSSGNSSTDLAHTTDYQNSRKVHVYSATKWRYVCPFIQSGGAFAPLTYQIVCFATDDAGATATTRTTIETFTGAGTIQPFVWTEKDDSGYLYAMWTTFVSGTASSNADPRFAKSTNEGSSWTIYPPGSELTAVYWYGGASGNVGKGFAMAPDGHLYFMSRVDISGTGPDAIDVWRSTTPYSLSEWERVLRVSIGSESGGAGLEFWTTTNWDRFAYNQFHILFDANGSRLIGCNDSSNAPSGPPFGPYSGYGNIEWSFIDIAYVAPTPPDEDLPEPEPIPGTILNNEYVRIDMANGRGWSRHFKEVSCWMSYDEGDKETGREVPILIGGEPSVDSSAGFADVLSFLFRVEAPEEMGNRTTAVNDGGQVVTVVDPLKFVWETKVYDMTDGFEQNVFRGVIVDYMRNGDDPLHMEVWVDGRLNRVLLLPNTYGEDESRFFAASAFHNVGSSIQFRVVDETLLPLAINSVAILYIKKKVRG